MKKLIDEKPKLSNRYKTFGGKVYNEVEDLKDELIFIHTNISASTCINRIANVMQKLNISNNVLKIKQLIKIK